MGPVSLRSRIESMEEWLDAWTARPIKGPRLAEKLAYVFQLEAEGILDQWRADPPSRPFFELLDYGKFYGAFADEHGISNETEQGVFRRQRECDLFGRRPWTREASKP